MRTIVVLQPSPSIVRRPTVLREPNYGADAKRLPYRHIFLDITGHCVDIIATSAKNPLFMRAAKAEFLRTGRIASWDQYIA